MREADPAAQPSSPVEEVYKCSKKSRAATAKKFGDENSTAPIAAGAPRQYHGNMNLGFPEMIFLFLMALIIFGPKKLPEIGRQIGRALNEFKRASNEFKAQIESEISQLELESNRQTILPPAQPSLGSVATGSSLQGQISRPETDSLAKAPDA